MKKLKILLPLTSIAVIGSVPISMAACGPKSDSGQDSTLTWNNDGFYSKKITLKANTNYLFKFTITNESTQKVNSFAFCDESGTLITQKLVDSTGIQFVCDTSNETVKFPFPDQIYIFTRINIKANKEVAVSFKTGNIADTVVFAKAFNCGMININYNATEHYFDSPDFNAEPNKRYLFYLYVDCEDKYCPSSLTFIDSSSTAKITNTDASIVFTMPHTTQGSQIECKWSSAKNCYQFDNGTQIPQYEYIISVQTSASFSGATNIHAHASC